jgi:molybdopterin molybdotransferase
MNSYNLAGLVTKEGAVPVKRGIYKDDYDLIRSVVEDSIKDSEMVLITGGSSVGARDMTAKIMDDLGKVLFHSVSLKPGKPTIAGIMKDKFVFGLPGHPRAVSVCFETFIRPVLRRISGMASERWDTDMTVKARLARSIHSAPGRQEHISVALEETEGELWARPLLGKSGLITALVRADGTVTVAQDRLGIDRGEIVEVSLS